MVYDDAEWRRLERRLAELYYRDETPHRKVGDMLSVDHYPQTFIDGCRARVDAQISAYQDLVAAAKDLDRTDETPLGAAIATFEPLFFNNMVLVLDNSFLHRSRNMEGKDGNPLNEVRVLCNSLLNNGGVLAADKQIKLDPAKSILKYQVGDEIKLSEADFVLLAKAFFAEIESRYP